MKKKQMASKKRTWLMGAIWFFILIAAIIQIAVQLYDYIQGKTQSNGVIALSMLGVIFLLAAFCTVFDYFRRKLTVEKPVRKILRATESIARGDFSIRLQIFHPYGKYDQYDLIMENLNVMAAELEKTEVLKTDFISNVSHELKTPLTVIKSYAALLADSNLEAETREKYAKAVLTATERLNGLIVDILRLNKLENQELKIEKEEFNLTESLGESILSFEDRMEEKQIALSCDLEEDVFVYSSKSYLEIVWNNLLSNAVKFTDEGGRVTVNLKKDGNYVVLSVADTGCGIPKETGARIFEKFYQGDTSHSGEGNGLGLALVKKVVDLLGGEISVESEIGKGSLFKVKLRA